MEHLSFVDRVMARMPAFPPRGFEFVHWPWAGRATEEAVAIMPIAGVDPARIMDAVMDVDHYRGNVEHVAASRSIADPRFTAPESVRFYQRIDLPLLGAVHHESVLHRLGERGPWQIAAWSLLRDETDRLNPKEAYRFDYSVGAWFAAPGVIGYALASAPKREDVGFLKWKALTTGADAAAPRVLRSNLEGMARWAARR